MGQDEVITIDRHPIGGDIYPQYRSDVKAQDADPEMDGDRVITQETDGLSTELLYGPNASSNHVSYETKYLVIENSDNPTYDGIYDLLPLQFTCSVSSGNDLTLHSGGEYLVYFNKVGYQDYRAVVFRTNDDTWVAFETTLNPELFFADDVEITNGQLNGETIAFSSQSRGGPYKIMKPTEFNLVTGEAERVTDANQITQNLQGPDNIVQGVAERELAAIDAAILCPESIVNGLAERITNANLITQELQGPEYNIVEGSGARHSNGVGVLVSGQSSLGGQAENQIDLEEGIAQVDDALVTGSGVRHSNTLSGITQVDPSTVNGVSERTTVGSGLLVSGNSSTNATVKRTVVSLDASLHDEASSVSAAAGDGERKVVVAGRDVYSGPSTVTSVVEITSNGSGTVESDSSTVNGVAERGMSAEGTLVAQDHEVTGISERKIVSIVADLKAQPVSVVGSADRESSVVSGIHMDTNSLVSGNAFRRITSVGVLEASDCEVDALVYTNNLEQNVIHTKRRYRIRKEKTRRILVRQTPTNV